MADAEATIADLQTHIAQLTEELAQLQQQRASDTASSSSGPVSKVKVLDIAATSDASSVPKFKRLSDIPHVASNPVRREAHFPVDPQLIDLKGSRGYEAVAQGGVPSMLHEFRHHASYFSYLYDYTAAFEQLIPGVASNELRTSLCVVLTGLREAQRHINNRLDFLKVFGEKRHSDPGLVLAVEQSIVGTADLPVSSTDILGAVGDYRSQYQKLAIKQGAVFDLPPPPWQGRGRGRGQSGRPGRQQQQGRQQQDQLPSSSGYNLRSRGQQQQQQQQQQ